MKTFWLVLAFVAALSQAAPVPNRLTVHLEGNDHPYVMGYRLWSGHPYVLLKDTWQLNWQPYLDEVHGLADVAGCIRLEPNSKRAVGIWRFSGARGISLGSALPLPVPTRTVAGEMWLPLDSVAGLMGYKVSFDVKKQWLALNVMANGDSIAQACQIFLQGRNS